jgi:transposase
VSYQKHPMASLIDVQPDEARKRILEAYAECGLQQGDAAAMLNVAESTLIRWVKRLAMGPQVEALRERARKKGIYKFGRPPSRRRRRKKRAA